MANDKRNVIYQITGAISSKFTSAMQATQTNLKKIETRLESFTHKAHAAEKASEGVSEFGGKLKETLIGVAEAVGAIELLKAGYEQCTEEANENIRANAGLERLMMNVKGATMHQVHALMEYDEAQEEALGISKKAIENGQAQLATFNLQSAAIKKLTPGLLDLSARTYGTLNVTMEQTQQTANLVGKAMDGNAGARRRVGITMTAAQVKLIKTGTAMQRAATIATVLKQNVGGFAAKLAETPEGKIARLNKQLDKVKESIGRAILPVTAQFIGLISSRLPQISALGDKVSEGVKKAGDAVRVALSAVTAWFVQNQAQFAAIRASLATIFASMRPGLLWVLKNGLPMLGRALSFILSVVAMVANLFAKNWGAIGPILIGIAVAFGAVSAAMRIAAIAQAALNVVMNLNPVGAIILAIGVLIGVIIWLYKNWDMVKKAIAVVWKAFIKFGTEGAGRFIPFVAIIALVGKHWTQIKAAILEAWNSVMKFINTAKAVGGAAFAVAVNAVHKVTHREGGGSVSRGSPYVVGERRPELFVPNSSGRIMPNLGMLGRGSGAALHLHVTFAGGTGGAAVDAGIRSGADYLLSEYDRRERDRNRRTF